PATTPPIRISRRGASGRAGASAGGSPDGGAAGSAPAASSASLSGRGGNSGAAGPTASSAGVGGVSRSAGLGAAMSVHADHAGAGLARLRAGGDLVARAEAVHRPVAQHQQQVDAGQHARA